MIMSQSLLILGRQPALGLAELESLFGADKVTPAGDQAALLDIKHEDVPFARLGGSMKLAKVLNVYDTTDWMAIEKQLRKAIPAHLQYVPEGKLKFGLSVYGFPPSISAGKINATALSLKKLIRAAGRSVRIVPNKEAELNTAQVLHNSLTSALGWELLLVRDGKRTILAQTTTVQDIEAYAARDQGRPKRDSRVGMLPPKLAQTIINLASGQNDPKDISPLLDPFCGTGVVLQEALLMGFSVLGSDLEPRMIEYTDKNLFWLCEHHHDINGTIQTAVGDATTHQWETRPATVAAETYLGQPFATLPAPEKLEQVRSGCNLILRKFLQNLTPQIKPGTRLCLAVPAWQRGAHDFVHLPTLDHLGELGYNRLSFEHVSNKDLVYARADQIVARELLILVKE